MPVKVLADVNMAIEEAIKLGVRAVAYYDPEIGGYSWMPFDEYKAGERGNINPVYLVYDTELGRR